MNFCKFIFSIFVVILSSVYAHKLEKFHDASNVSFNSDVDSSSCTCSTYDCGCCTHIDILKIKGTVCANISYLPNDYEVSLTLTFNNYVLINETVSATNPPPICVKLSELIKVNAEICLVFFKLSWRSHEFSGCAAIKILVFHWIHKSINLGCFSEPILDINEIKSIENVINDIEQVYEHDLEEIRKIPIVQII